MPVGEGQPKGACGPSSGCEGRTAAGRGGGAGRSGEASSPGPVPWVGSASSHRLRPAGAAGGSAWNHPADGARETPPSAKVTCAKASALRNARPLPWPGHSFTFKDALE